MKGDDWKEPLWTIMRAMIIETRMAAFPLKTGLPLAGLVNQARGLGKAVTIVPAKAISSTDSPSWEKIRWPGWMPPISPGYQPRK